MRGLRLTQIRSLGLDYGFNRYQLWEHEIIPVQSTRKNVWMPGKIIHHIAMNHNCFVSWKEASEYFKALAPQYDELDLELDPHNMELSK